MYGSVTVVNSTFTLNTADGGRSNGGGGNSGGGNGSGYGGAIFNLDGTVSLTNATLAGDTVSTDGGELYNLAYGKTPAGGTVNATAVIVNSILANSTGGTSDLVNNTDPTHASGTATVTAADNDIIRTSSGTISGATAPLAVDPLLDPAGLANNGGLTQTIGLQANSPAIDAGNNAAATTAGLTTDQRGSGFARISGARVDVGAFELQHPVVQFADAAQNIAENGGPQMIRVTLSTATTVDITVPITLSGTAVEGTDYTVSAPSVTIPAGGTSASFILTPIDLHEFTTPNRTVLFGLGTLTNASTGTPASDNVTIISDPAPTVSFAVASQTVNETDGTFTITINLSAVSGADTTIPFLLGGTAVAGTDYSGVNRSPLVIAAGQTSAMITGTVLPDPGSNPTLTFTLGTPTNATLGATTTEALTIVEPPAPTPPPPERFSPPFISVAFGPNGEVAEVVNSAGVLTQYSAAGVQVLGGGVRYASIAFGPNGFILEVVEIVNTAGVLTQFDVSGHHQLGGAGVESASITFGPGGEVLEVVLADGSLTQFSDAGAQKLGTGGVVSASVTFGPNGLVVDLVNSTGVLTQFSAAGPLQLGGAGVQSAGVTFTSAGEVLDIIFSDGSLDQFDAFGQQFLGMVS